MVDLLTEYRFQVDGRLVRKRIVGGLLGHCAVWTHRAVELFEQARSGQVEAHLLAVAAQLTDANAAIFERNNGFAGCIAGIHELLRRQGLLDNVRLLDERERLSPGQAAELDRVMRAYPHLRDGDFVRLRLERWLAGDP